MTKSVSATGICIISKAAAAAGTVAKHMHPVYEQHYAGHTQQSYQSHTIFQTKLIKPPYSSTTAPTLRAYALASFTVQPPSGSNPPSVMLSPMVKMTGRFQMVGSALPRYAPGMAAALLPLSGLGTTSAAAAAAAGRGTAEQGPSGDTHCKDAGCYTNASGFKTALRGHMLFNQDV
jgi:hypothetical protein